MNLKKGSAKESQEALFSRSNISAPTFKKCAQLSEKLTIFEGSLVK